LTNHKTFYRAYSLDQGIGHPDLVKLVARCLIGLIGKTAIDFLSPAAGF
jgi:hypothetical protein